MLPKAHIILGFFFSVILLLLFPQVGFIGAGIIWLSSFLIDVDHYIWYVIEERGLSLKKAYQWHIMKRKVMAKLSREERRKHKNEIIFLHGFESLAILYFLSWIWQPFMFVFIGFSFHLLVDLYEEVSEGHRIDKISVIWDIWKYKKLKKLK